MVDDIAKVDLDPPAAPAGGFPSISDYWPDAPHRMGPPADFYHDPIEDARRPPRPEPAAPGTKPTGTRPPARAGRRKLIALLLTVAVLAAAGIAVTTLTRHRDTGTVANRAPDSGSAPAAVVDDPVATAAATAGATPVPTVTSAKPSADTHAVSAPLNGLTTAGFELASDAVTVNLRSAVLGGDLFRITTPATSGVLPRATVRGGAIRLTLARVGKTGKAAVDVTLNAGVRWSIRVSGGVSQGALDLHDLALTAVELAGDAARIDLQVPRPDGTLPVRITGGLNQLRLTTAGGVAIRVRARGGAGQVVLNGRTDNGVARGRSFTSGPFDASTDRIDLDATVGIGSVIVAGG
jgi:hypothetical protein